jgi:hypothetical protein
MTYVTDFGDRVKIVVGKSSKSTGWPWAALKSWIELSINRAVHDQVAADPVPGTSGRRARPQRQPWLSLAPLCFALDHRPVLSQHRARFLDEFRQPRPAFSGTPRISTASPRFPRRRNAAADVFSLKTGDAIPVEGLLPLRQFFLGEHVAVIDFAQAKCAAANREYDRGLLPSAPPCQTTPRKNFFEVNGGRLPKFVHAGG